MDVSKKLFVFFLLSQLLQMPSITVAHPITPIGIAEEIVTQEDLHTALISKIPTVIMLKMEPCPHCNALKPDFAAAAKNPAYKNINFYIANGPKLQAAQTVKSLSGGTIKIPGFPSIIYVNHGKIVDHQIGGNSKTLIEKTNKLAKMN